MFHAYFKIPIIAKKFSTRIISELFNISYIFGVPILDFP
ncbi:hypothetical protein UF75_5413 [Desulfosporosinus sp. I2]|nr:hypothetical protein UF75_5413 [Desulfosporosinus sp. I2]